MPQTVTGKLVISPRMMRGNVTVARVYTAKMEVGIYQPLDDNLTSLAGLTLGGNGTKAVAVKSDGSGLELVAMGSGGNGSGNGSVSSVAMTVPTGLSVSGSPITSSGTFDVTYSSGYSIPTTTKQGQWDTAYSWGNHLAEGYLTGISGEILANLSDVTITSVEAGELLKWNGSAWVNSSLGDAGIATTSHASAHVNGTDDIQLATASQKGLMSVDYATKLEGIEPGATADQSAEEILAALLTVDGHASGLDADSLDGYDAAAFSLNGHDHDGDYAHLSHVGDTLNPHSVTAAQVGLGSVENTALSTWAGSTNITTLGTIATGVWGGTAIEATALASTGETGGVKFLRENGDGTVSFVAIPGGGDALTSATLDQFADVAQTSGKTLAITGNTTLAGGTYAGNVTGNNTGDETAERIRALGFFDATNDGSGSGLDADLFRGQEPSAFAAAGHNHDTAYAAIGHNHDGTYATAGHNHDAAYAAIGHNHDGTYAAAVHNHDGTYALAGHNHDGSYAPADHNHHDAYAAIGHNHDGTYATAGHNHDADYAAIGHNHDGSYSAIGHNHDGTYAAAGHDHDAAYAAIGHNHDAYYQAFDDNLTSLAGLTLAGNGTKAVAVKSDGTGLELVAMGSGGSGDVTIPDAAGTHTLTLGVSGNCTGNRTVNFVDPEGNVTIDLSNFANGTYTPTETLGSATNGNMSTANTTLNPLMDGSGNKVCFYARANRKYPFTVKIPWKGPATTDGFKVSLSGPASPNVVWYAFTTPTTTGTINASSAATAFGTTLTQASGVNMSGAWPIMSLDGFLDNGNTSGNVTVEVASEVGSNTTFYAGAHIVAHELP